MLMSKELLQSSIMFEGKISQSSINNIFEWSMIEGKVVDNTPCCYNIPISIRGFFVSLLQHSWARTCEVTYVFNKYPLYTRLRMVYISWYTECIQKNLCASFCFIFHWYNDSFYSGNWNMWDNVFPLQHSIVVIATQFLIFSLDENWLGATF